MRCFWARRGHRHDSDTPGLIFKDIHHHSCIISSNTRGLFSLSSLAPDIHHLCCKPRVFTGKNRERCGTSYVPHALAKRRNVNLAIQSFCCVRVGCWVALRVVKPAVRGGHLLQRVRCLLPPLRYPSSLSATACLPQRNLQF